MPRLSVTHHATVDALQSTRHEFEYIYRPYQTGQYNYQPDVIPATEIQVSEDSSLATMIASESVLAKDWDTPEEDEAWADL